jgi:hypothetical protein
LFRPRGFVAAGQRSNTLELKWPGVLDLLGAGYPINKIVKNYQGRVPRDAVLEAIDLAAKAFSKQMVRASSR